MVCLRHVILFYVAALVQSNSWDTDTNPGPESRSHSHFPCGLCDVSVGWEDRGFVWYHIDCQGMSQAILNAKNLAPPFLSIFSGTKSMISKINVLLVFMPVQLTIVVEKIKRV